MPEAHTAPGESLFHTVVTDHFWLIVCSATYVLACWYVIAHTPAANFDTSHNYLVWPGFAGTLLLGLVIAVCFNVLALNNSSRPLRFIGQEIAIIFRPHHLLGGLLVLFLSSPVIFYSLQIKSLIPHLNPVVWDIEFSHADYVLFLGHYPHEYLSFLISSSMPYQILSFFYEAIWTSVCIGVLAYSMFVAEPGFRRSRFLLAYFLCWMVIGTVCAIAFSSGGPVFFNAYTGGHVYDALVAQLAAVSGSGDKMFSAYTLMQTLGSFHANVTAPPAGMGISAMPSMHVCMAVIVYLYARRVGAWSRLLALLYFIGIYLASIALGWHYAVDGLVSVVLTVCIWRLAAWLVDKQEVIMRASSVPGARSISN